MLTQIHGAIRTLLAFVLVAVMLVASLLGAASALAQEADAELPTVSYIHAAVLGTGTYSLHGRRVTMLKMPFAWKQRPATPESVGWRWLFPTVLGYDDLSKIDSDFISALLPDQLVTLTVMPGVEFVYPVNEHLYIKPFIELGGGHDFNNHESFALTQLGVRSLSPFEFGENWQLLIGAAARWAGEYQFDSEENNAFGIIDLGADVRRNLPWKLFDQRLNIGAYYIYQRYLPEWGAGEAVDWKSRARELHEFGLSLGVPHGKRIFGINVRRVRVGFKKGGDFQGWTFGTEFPF
jgi:hypothetical protein